MSSFIVVLLMAAALGATSFGIGCLPLFFTFSSESLQPQPKISLQTTDTKKNYEEERIMYLSTLGTGLLIGAALGIIIPEYVASLPRRQQAGVSDTLVSISGA